MNLTADANSMSWDFWGHWADGRWEPRTREVIFDHCHGGTFVDIGAWVGPTSIWAMQSGYGRVVSVEPDPDARVMLRENVGTAHETIHPMPTLPEVVEAAIGWGGDWTSIEVRGDSMSRIGLVGLNEPLEYPNRPVRCLTIETLFARWAIENVDLIKMDVEGAEARILPQAEPFLRTVGAPLHLSTHPWDPLDWTVFDGWTVERLGDDEWLVTP